MLKKYTSMIQKSTGKVQVSRDKKEKNIKGQTKTISSRKTDNTQV